MHKNQDFKRIEAQQTQRGSVLIWIFVMIAILSALYFVVSSGFRAGETNLSEERVELYATEILDYAQSVKQAVQTLQINGCSDEEISFESNSNSGYTNPNAPADNSCHVFHPSGGGLTWLKNTGGIGGFIEATGRVRVYEVGSDLNSELLFRWWDIDENICTAINEKVGLTGTSLTPPGAGGNTCPTSGGTCEFVGAYNQTHNIDNAANEFHSKTIGCYDENSTGTRNVFYQVLIAR
ncbi:MAG: hypothetical protein AAF988_04690 [Pseudomonadota bacterium]